MNLISNGIQFIRSNLPLVQSLIPWTSEIPFSTPSLFWLFTGAVASYAIPLLVPQTDRQQPTIIRQAVEAHPPDPTKDKSMLILSTTYDINSSSQTFVWHIKNFAKKFNIDVLEGYDKKDIQNQMNTHTNKKYDVIVIHAHGFENGIYLAEKSCITSKSIRIFQWLKNLLKENGGKIVLHSCSTGKGSENIAKEMSRSCPNADIYATDSDLNGYIGAEYDEDATPRFNDGYFCTASAKLVRGRDSTRVYRAGELSTAS